MKETGFLKTRCENSPCDVEATLENEEHMMGPGADDRRASLMTVTLNGCRLGKMLRVLVPLIQQKKQEKTFLSNGGL